MAMAQKPAMTVVCERIDRLAVKAKRRTGCSGIQSVSIVAPFEQGGLGPQGNA